MGLKPFKHRAVCLVVHHLRLALEILEAGAFAVTRGERLHEGLDVAVPAEMPVVIGDRVGQRPAVSRRHHGFDGFERGERWGASLHREATRKIGKVSRRRPVVVRTGSLQIHDVRAAHEMTRAIEFGNDVAKSLIENGLRYTLVSTRSEEHTSELQSQS